MPEEDAKRTIAGKYRLTRLIGRGGMGSVWEAEHLSLGTTFALKVIGGEGGIDEETRLRFLNEARAAARLQSRHVVRVFDHGVTESGEPYIAMELLRGEPLSLRLARVGKLSLQETATIMGQTARALSQAHDMGIIHRDLKPENIFLTRELHVEEEFVKVVDFGIAKLPKTPSDVSPDTRTGEIMGTPYYMSPEQARGIKTADQRADLWSLGVIAYRCAVGCLPFDGNTLVDLMIRITTSPIPVPSEKCPTLPRDFDSWFHKAVARDPEDRFATAMDLAAELARIAGIPFNREASLRSRISSLDAAPPAAFPSSANATSPKVYSSTLGRSPASSQRTGIALAAIAATAVVAGFAAFALVRSPRTGTEPSEPPSRVEPEPALSHVTTEFAGTPPATAASASISASSLPDSPPPVAVRVIAKPPTVPPPASTNVPRVRPSSVVPPAPTDVGY